MLSARRPVAPIDYIADLGCPLLGLFGNDDPNPSPEHVDRLEVALKAHGKSHEFHRYDGAGHAFMSWYRPHYRVAQSNDAWTKVLDFLRLEPSWREAVRHRHPAQCLLRPPRGWR